MCPNARICLLGEGYRMQSITSGTKYYRDRRANEALALCYRRPSTPKPIRIRSVPLPELFSLPYIDHSLYFYEQCGEKGSSQLGSPGCITLYHDGDEPRRQNGSPNASTSVAATPNYIT
ncbi:hypothetical protein D915_010933 [Fasciola hepatica]|uniref:Uncharacterized protein n=1 Tax=Fasciola hepatica TaxID=6192 RepID=A0A4E0RVD2_FASHE|nr:hypothetical protein D915_010933 [Fasciola hepatica]